jgi:hypothetical protein
MLYRRKPNAFTRIEENWEQPENSSEQKSEHLGQWDLTPSPAPTVIAEFHGLRREVRYGLNFQIAGNPPRVLHWNAPSVGCRIMKVATIRWDFPQGHVDERSARWDPAGKP